MGVLRVIYQGNYKSCQIYIYIYIYQQGFIGLALGQPNSPHLHNITMISIGCAEDWLPTKAEVPQADSSSAGSNCTLLLPLWHYVHTVNLTVKTLHTMIDSAADHARTTSGLMFGLLLAMSQLETPAKHLQHYNSGAAGMQPVSCFYSLKNTSFSYS